MIVPSSLRRRYEEAKENWTKVQEASDTLLQNVAKNFGGTYESRIKSIESAILKIEKNAIQQTFSKAFYELEDMLAGTIVVPDLGIIPLAAKAIEADFSVHNKPSRMPAPYRFDGSYDKHLIVSLKDTPLIADRSITDFKFEIQVKTFLQHAWAKAEHDLVYKPRRMSYGLARTSNQIRALLELADAVLANLEEVEALVPESDYPEFAQVTEITTLLTKHWEPAVLPLDMRRTALVIKSYMDLAKITSISDLDEIISKPVYADYLGLRSVTPTQAILMILFMEKTSNMTKLTSGKGVQVLVTEEMESFCQDLSKIPASNRVSY
jgi:ppGpp synthetase/RelA/SpoT-type nucleotidyltranferase